MEQPILMAVDWGAKRSGVAFSDGLGLMAHPFGALDSTNRKTLIAQLAELCRERAVTEILVGKPLHLDGRAAAITAEAEGFAAALGKATGLPVTMRDERLTSWDARALLKETHPHPTREQVDAAAAALLLQDELDERRRHGA